MLGLLLQNTGVSYCDRDPERHNGNMFYAVRVTPVRMPELLKQEKRAPPLKCSHQLTSKGYRTVYSYNMEAWFFYTASGVAIDAGIVGEQERAKFAVL